MMIPLNHKFRVFVENRKIKFVLALVQNVISRFFLHGLDFKEVEALQEVIQKYHSIIQDEVKDVWMIVLDYVYKALTCVEKLSSIPIHHKHA
jgi:hypothetical protein